MCNELHFVVGKAGMERKLPRCKVLHQLREHRIFGDEFFAPRPNVALDLVATLTHLLAIGEYELHIDNLDILVRLDFIIDMHDVRIIKETNDL